MASLDLPLQGIENDGLGAPQVIREPQSSPPIAINRNSTMSAHMKELQVPIHPIPSMQGAFAESMLEASLASTPTLPRTKSMDAAARRRKLLDQPLEEDTHAAKWKQKPGQRYHELWKLMAQISFGIYLLLNGIAKDDEQVLNILQGHVDEVDAFLEGTLADFDLASKDIQERLKFLKMPLENIEIFDAMLEDRQFRLQIVTGNERIEHIIHRTASAMNDALKDVQQGLDATKEFAKYLAQEEQEADWNESRPEMQKVYDAMKGNAEGWHKAYVTLQTKGNRLGEALVQLGSIVAEMDKRAGQVSRKTRFSLKPAPAPVVQTSPRPKSPPSRSPSHSSRPSLNSVASSTTKDLPSDPSMITPAIRATLPAFQYVGDRERTPETRAVEPAAPTTIPEEEEEEEEEDSPVFTLQPRTYSPAPYSAPPAHRAVKVVTIAAEPPPPNKLKKRFSLKRKAVPEMKEIPEDGPAPTTLAPTYSQSVPNLSHEPFDDDDEDARTDYHSYLESTRSSSRNNTALEHARSVTATPQPRHNYSSTYVASPRSDQQHFHPVHASPHSPLQRPWTAAPTNLRSTTSLSNLSQMSSVTEDGKKVRKKRSGLGWLKKAFSLSEEEKQVFQEKRMAAPPPRYAVDRRPQFLDGKRIR